MDMIDQLDHRTSTRRDPVKTLSIVTLVMILVFTVYSCIATPFATTLPYTIYDEAMILSLGLILTIIPVSRIYDKHINLVFSGIIFVISFILICLFIVDIGSLFIIPFLLDIALLVTR
ncbi:MAG: hypothetical protein LVQ96_08285 [Thermoplasmatales archaeon]|nr:hypothetical protein [Thermoplasmatales archaeon]